MEPIVFFALILVVAVKAFTTHSIHALEAKIRAAQAEEADVSQRLQKTESSLRSLEKEHKGLEQELKHLENDKDLAILEVTKAGGKPLTEEQLEQLLQAAATPTKPPAQAKSAPAQPETNTQPPSTPQPQAETQSAAPHTTDEEHNPDPSEEHTPTKPVATGAPPPQRTTQTTSSPNISNVSDDNEALDTNSKRDPDAKPRILVVDDNDELRSLLKQALSKDYEVLEAPNGFEALSQILKQKQVYDLVITDLNMPKVNGITLIEHLPADIPTIIISAFLNKPEFKKALAELQPAGVLEKPFQMATLRNTIQEALASQIS